jgi:dienelactone hydrolase
MNHPAHQPLTRRTLLKQAGLGLLGTTLPQQRIEAATACATSAATSAPPLPPAPVAHNRFPRLVQDYYMARIREAERIADARRAALRTKADAEAYVRDVRGRIQECFGPWPEKTPLRSHITGVLDRDTYLIEKLIFESRPEFLVTANVYVPKPSPGGKPGRRLPGIVVACGHYPEGKAAETYQAVAQTLARFGHMVLIFDPLGQGERLQYPDARLESLLGAGVDEHLHAGNQQVLVGESLAAWRTWDGIRALDYLLTRPEVDPARIGITGNSGGGTDATWLCGADPRWTMAAPQCFVTTFRRNLENELPADPEQCPPRALALGLDHSDFIAAFAPKPVVLLGQEKDFFDVRGLEEAHARLRRLYELLGAPENLELVISSDYHSYSQPSREALYRWFNRFAEIDRDPSEPALTLEPPADLRCTPEGQVSALGSRPLHAFTREKSQALRRTRATLSLSQLANSVRAALKLPSTVSVSDYRILRPEKPRGFPKKHAAGYVIDTEPNACALVYGLSDEPLLSRPPRTGGRAFLYVCHQSSDEELRSDRWLGELIAQEPAPAAAFTCDPRGSGESRPNTCGKAYTMPYGADYFYAAHGLMFDYPYVTQKTFDVLCVLRWLAAHGRRDIHLAAAGWGTLPAAFAALLTDEVTQVTLKNAPQSYAEIAETSDYAWPLSTFVPGVLEAFDLPDCYRALAAKKLRQVEPWNARTSRA